MFTTRTILLALLLCGSATVFSMHGQGGGILYAPIQVLFGVDFHQAAASSQLFIILTSVSSTLVFRKARRIDWSAALVLESSAGIGGYLGGFFAHRFTAATMLAVLGLVVLVAALSMMSGYRQKEAPNPPPASKWMWERETAGRTYNVNLALGMPLGFLIGLVSGLTGVAGGFLKIPMMILLFGMPIDIAFGTSAFMISLTAAGGLLGHMTSGPWDWRPALFLGMFVVVGAQIGPRLTLLARTETLQWSFGRLLLLVSVALFYLAWKS